jgi:hypothetical protein
VKKSLPAPLFVSASSPVWKEPKVAAPVLYGCDELEAAGALGTVPLNTVSVSVTVVITTGELSAYVILIAFVLPG